MCERAARLASRRVSPMPPAGEDPDAAPSCSGAVQDGQELERVLPNGDLYRGQWRGAVPHGAGKYLWVDGCMYEGEWRRGKATGRGRFSWPSGATYEGEFLDGFMHGAGTYVGAAGDTYRGAWAKNLEHGAGEKRHANGDRYDGEWRAGLPDGCGRYAWRDGTEYAGGWRAGLIHGRGALVWANGNRYDGGWEGGRPRGQGTFRWADGSLYVGFWGREAPGGSVHQKGVYYPSPAAAGESPRARDPREVFARELPECVHTGTEGQSALTSLRSLKWLARSVSGRGSSASSRSTGSGGSLVHFWGSDGDVKCDIGDDWRRRSVREGRGLPPPSPAPHLAKATPLLVSKQQGLTIAKGHKNYELMLNLQLGIRHAVGRQGQPILDLKSSAFDPKEKVWTKFPPEGSKHTPPHNSCDFRWKDYCPKVFRTLRKLFKVDPADYMLSLCGDDALRELSSPGKSGSFFYLTNDDRYMIKTMKKSEVKMLLKMLPAYYKHVRAFENTLVTKFFGLHCVKAGAHQKKKQWFQEFQRCYICWGRQVDKDCEFLEQEKIMDYSLLVGVHFRGAIDIDGDIPATPRLSRWDRDHFLSDPNRWSTIKLGANMLSRAELTKRKNDGDIIGEPTGEYCDVILSPAASVEGMRMTELLGHLVVPRSIKNKYTNQEVDDVRVCGGGTWWRRTRESTQLGGEGSERARELGVVAEQNFRGGRGERNFEKIRLCGGWRSGWGQHVRHCGGGDEQAEVRGPRGRERRKTTGRRAKTVRVEDAGDGRGLPPPSPATGPHASGRSRGARRQGETIAKGHKNYELMLNLQLGIRHAVGKQGPITLDLKSSAFDPKEKALRELSSPGKSGSFFYLTSNDQYMIKTMKKSEVKVCTQVDRDCEFLEQENIMDYSLLVGVHFRDKRDRLLTGGSFDSDSSRGSSPCLSRGDTDPSRLAKIKLGSNMPTRAELTVRKTECELQIMGEPTGEFYDVILYFGIIDILQDYDISKKLEHAYKSFQYDPTSISAVDPKQYSRRFRDFVFKAFQEEKLDF
ncbi:hypothetical protein EJB05_06585, partial [Eragrostis curvula]